MYDPRGRFEEIYDRYSGLILAYLARRVADPNDAADILAETFMVAWRRIDEVPSGEDARPWLYGVARKVLSNHRRGNRRRSNLEARLKSEVASLVPVAQVSDTSRTDIAAAFGELGPGDRELLMMVGWDGLQRDDIAAILGCNRATVRLRLHRARKRFDEALGRHGSKRSSDTGHEVPIWRSVQPDLEEM